jgi:hypothetical protein
MASLWQRAQDLAGQELSTKDGKRFTFVVATERRIDVTPEDGTQDKPIGIYRREFDIAERAGLVRGGVRPKELTEAGVSRGPSYVAGIINTVTGPAGL